MKMVELIKGMDYLGRGVKAVKGKPFSVTDDKAEELSASGFFKVLGETECADKEPADESQKEAELTAEDIEKMKKDKLIALATEKEINLDGCNNNEERAERIKGALGLANFAKLGFEE